MGLPWRISAAAKGADYYVSTSGDDGHSGLAKASAWRTIARAAQRVQGGDTVHIQGGDYGPERVVIEITAAAAQPCRLRRLRRRTRAQRRPRHGPPCRVLASIVHIRNIRIMNYSDNGVKLHRSRHCVLEAISVVNCAPRGQVFYVRDSDHNSIQDCEVLQETVNADYYFVLAYSHYNSLLRRRSVHALGFDSAVKRTGSASKTIRASNPSPTYHSHHNTFVNCTAVNHGDCFEDLYREALRREGAWELTRAEDLYRELIRRCDDRQPWRMRAQRRTVAAAPPGSAG